MKTSTYNQTPHDIKKIKLTLEVETTNGQRHVMNFGLAPESSAVLAIELTEEDDGLDIYADDKIITSYNMPTSFLNMALSHWRIVDPNG